MTEIDNQEIVYRIELVQLRTQQLVQLLPLLDAISSLQRWLEQPKLPSEAQIRRAHSYWREVRRSEAEFNAAYPDWK